jgi:hypothetical protein
MTPLISATGLVSHAAPPLKDVGNNFRMVYKIIVEIK